MSGGRKLLLAFVLAALLAGSLAACGGDDSSDSTATTTQGAATPGGESGGDAGEDGGETPGESDSPDDSGSPEEGSAAFRAPGGDNSIQNFGEEADADEVEAASATLAGYMEARANDEWEKECAHLARVAVEPLEQLAARSAQLEGKDCAGILAALSGGAPPSTRANTMTGPIASLRADGERGFALYHGAKGVDYFMPMAEEDGEWKVGALAPTEFP